MKDYTWVIQEQELIPDVDNWSKKLQIHPKIVPLLWQRGFQSIESSDSFFKPSTKQLHSPFLMADMQKAVDRLDFAISNNQKILVYGDYDVDGTTAVAICYSFLKKLQCNVSYYVPDRYTEGYGVSMKGIEHAIQQKVDLLITLDCGIKANETIEYASKHGIDVIICDHHEQGEKLPNAYAVLDPKRKDCKYPFKELSGCGVGFKLLHAYCEQKEISLKENLYCYLDILAISIASDIVPIVDENRIYMYFGLLKMKAMPQIGIKAMILTSSMSNTVTVRDVVFVIGPRINAAGRIYKASTSVELLISENFDEAVSICETINDYNTERRNLDKAITQEAIKLIESDKNSANKVTNVLFKPDWVKGVIGIVASRVIETYYKPTIIFCGESEIISASARSVADFDLYHALEECSYLLENFGGHTYAAGMTLKREKFQEFADAFENVVSKRITPLQLQPKINIDVELETSDVSLSLYDQLQRFEPFGPKNMTPVFMIKNLVDTGDSRVVGSDESHLKLSLCHPNSPEIIVEGIGFGLSKKWIELKKISSTFDVCFVLKENIFKGVRKVQMEIRDMRVASL